MAKDKCDDKVELMKVNVRAVSVWLGASRSQGHAYCCCWQKGGLEIFWCAIGRGTTDNGWFTGVLEAMNVPMVESYCLTVVRLLTREEDVF